jgi:hypothetical protein
MTEMTPTTVEPRSARAPRKGRALSALLAALVKCKHLFWIYNFVSKLL